MKITIHREGEFKIKSLKLQEGRCGIAKTPCNFNYSVDITVDSTNLLANSFVIDVMEIQNYFDNKYNRKLKKCPCCEEIAMSAVIFFKFFTGRRAEIIKVEISPVAGRKIIAEWKRDDWKGNQSVC